MTPYEKLKSLADAEQCPTRWVTFEHLDAVARGVSDLAAAAALNQARAELFGLIDQENSDA